MKKLSTFNKQHDSREAVQKLVNKKTLVLVLATFLILAAIGENARLALLNW